MKVLLKQNVRKVGNKGELVDVADGYAYNSLIPQGLAVVATPGILNKIKAEEKQAQKKEEQNKEASVKAIKTLDGKTFLIKKTLTEKGTLFSAIHLDEVLEVVQKESGEIIGKELVKKFTDIKEAGTVEVPLQFEKVKGSFFIQVVG